MAGVLRQDLFRTELRAKEHKIMSTEMSKQSPEAIRVEMKRRFDAVNAAAEESHRLRRERDDIKEAKAYNRELKHVTVPAVAREVSGGMGENDSLGG